MFKAPRAEIARMWSQLAAWTLETLSRFPRLPSIPAEIGAAGGSTLRGIFGKLGRVTGPLPALVAPRGKWRIVSGGVGNAGTRVYDPMGHEVKGIERIMWEVGPHEVAKAWLRIPVVEADVTAEVGHDPRTHRVTIHRNKFRQLDHLSMLQRAEYLASKGFDASRPVIVDDDGTKDMVTLSQALQAPPEHPGELEKA